MRIRLVFALLILSAGLGLVPAQASSHREAPGITKMPKVDSTDFYMFNSYESGRSGYVDPDRQLPALPAPLRRPQLLLPGSRRALPHPHRQHRRRRRGHHLPVPRGAAAGRHQAAGGRPERLRAAVQHRADLRNDVPGGRSPQPEHRRELHDVGDPRQDRQRRRHRPAASSPAPPAAPASTSRRTTSARSRSPTTPPTRPTSSRSSSSPAARAATPSAGSSSASARSRSRSTSARSST